MPPLKGLAGISLMALAITFPAFAQSIDANPPARRAPAAVPGNSSVAPTDQQAAPKARKHHRRNKKSTTIQGQPGTSPGDQR